MTKKLKRPLSLILSIIMIVSVFAVVPLTAYADSWTENPYASLVNTTNTVKFNGMAWYVIEDNSTAVNAGTLTLLARDPLCARVFNNGDRYTDNIDQYSNSDVRNYLDGLTTGSGSFAGVADAIVPVDLTDVNVTGAKIWLLSLNQAQTIFNTNKFVLICTKANGVTDGLNYCWTRTKTVGSPDGQDNKIRNNTLGFFAGDNGKVKGSVNGSGMQAYKSGNVRPALQLDLSKVTLSSVTVTLSGGANATTTGGGRIQRFFGSDTSIETVYYHGGTCGTFPATSEYYTTTDGITVEYVDSKTLKVSGTPTKDDVNITIPDATANHNFSYSASGATITAGCKTSGCPARSSFDPVKLTIAAPADDGSSTEATLINLDAFNSATNLSITTSDIKYYNATKSGSTYNKNGDALEGAPTVSGDYLAEITVSGATASVGYTAEDKHVAAVISMIDALPAAADVTTGDAQDIEDAREAYDALTPLQQTFIDDNTLAKLTAAETALAAAQNNAAADEVAQMINDLPAAADVTTGDAQDIEDAREAYDNLTDAQKALVDADTLAILEAAEAALEDAQQAAADQAAADEVAQMIADLPDPQNVTVDDGDDIEAAMAAYLSLTADQIVLVPEASVTRLEEIVNAYADAAQAAADQAAADAVTQMIAGLPAPTDVTVGDKDAIEAAGYAFANLTNDQKALVPAASTAKLQAVAQAFAVVAKEAADQAAADGVTYLINQIPAEVTSNDAEAVENARKAYNMLTDDQKALIDADTLAKLEAAEDALLPELENYSSVETDNTTLNSEVKLFGAAEGGKPGYTYAFMYKLPGSSRWIVLGTKFGDSDQETLVAEKSGTYTVLITVKDSKGNKVSKQFSITVEDTTVVNNSSVSKTEVSCGEKVTITGAAEGGEAPYLYTYQVKKPGKTSWTTLGEKYTDATSKEFTAKLSGEYEVRVLVKDSAGFIKSFKTTVTSTGTLLVNNSTISTTTAAVGDSVTLNAVAEEGTAPYRYTYELKKPGETKFKTVGKRGSSNESASFTADTAGTYEAKVFIQDESNFVTVKTFSVEVSADS